MSQSLSMPQLSPSFERARRVSKILSVLLSIGFWVTLVMMAVLLCGLVVLLVLHPDASALQGGKVGIGGATIYLEKLSDMQRIFACAAVLAVTAPSLFILHHAHRVFRHFKQGDVFAAAPIEHIRQTGLWLMISLAANFAGQILLDLALRNQESAVDFDVQPLTLLFGLAIYVAAYVMAEARRIADENASIV